MFPTGKRLPGAAASLLAKSCWVANLQGGELAAGEDGTASTGAVCFPASPFPQQTLIANSKSHLPWHRQEMCRHQLSFGSHLACWWECLRAPPPVSAQGLSGRRGPERRARLTLSRGHPGRRPWSRDPGRISAYLRALQGKGWRPREPGGTQRARTHSSSILSTIKMLFFGGGRGNKLM